MATGPVAISSTLPQNLLSLSGGSGFQSTQLMPKRLQRQHVCLSRLKRLRDIQVIRAIRSGDLRGIRNLLLVYPDFRGIVDPADTQPVMPAFRIHWRGEFIAIPPAPAAMVWTVGGHRQILKICTFGIGGPRNSAKIVSEIGVGKDSNHHLRGHHRGGHGRADPTLRRKFRSGNLFPARVLLAGGPQLPTVMQGGHRSRDASAEPASRREDRNKGIDFSAREPSIFALRFSITVVGRGPELIYMSSE